MKNKPENQRQKKHWKVKHKGFLPIAAPPSLFYGSGGELPKFGVEALVYWLSQ